MDNLIEFKLTLIVLNCGGIYSFRVRIVLLPQRAQDNSSRRIISAKK